MICDIMVMEDTWMPFTEDQLSSHFSKDGKKGKDGLSKHLDHFRDSIEIYNKQFMSDNRGYQRLVDDLSGPCQIEKDEKFWTASTLMTLYHSETRVKDLSNVFKKAYGSDKPPLTTFQTWEECFQGNLSLIFELNFTPTPAYLKWLKKNRKDRHIVPYIINADLDEEKLEGNSKIDAVFINETNNFAALIEAKVTSDLSHDVRYDLTRNQFARFLDCLIEPSISKKSNFVLKPDKMLFVLLSPKIVRDNPNSRFYGMKFKEYTRNSLTIGQDLPHRSDVDWNNLSKRLGWLTWEDCHDVNLKCCPWFQNQ
jgi:hypothetical protein